MFINPDKELVIRAESGEVEAIKELASLFCKSDDEMDQRKAFMLYQKANEISHDDPATIAQIACCYCDGIGTNKDVAKGLKMLREASESENSDVQYLYAHKLKEKNDPECIEWFEKIYCRSENISGQAAYNIACIYNEGTIVERNQEKQNEYLWKAAEAGEQNAVRELCEINAMYISNGKHESVTCLEKLAQLGSVVAAKNLANFYLNGQHIENNIAKAFEWAGVVAKNGDPEFAYEFAKFEFVTEINDGEFHDRLKCLEAAAQKNHLRAIKLVAAMYESFDAIKNMETAKNYYIRALELNDSSALIFLMGLVGYSQEGKNEYFQIVKKSADNGCAAAIMEMYNIFHNGYYIAKDERKAKDYLEEAVKTEFPSALRTIGSYYANGDFGYPEDKQKAFTFWTKAAEGKDGTAAELIGNYYQCGILVQPNIDTAIEWYNKAIEYNNPRGYYEIGSIYEKAEFSRQDYEKALYYYTKGHECGDISSTLALARKYESGNGVEADPTKAFNLFKQAANRTFDKDIIIKVAVSCLEGIGTEANPVMAVEYLERIQYLNDAYVQSLLNEARNKCTPEALLEYNTKKAESGNHKAEYDLYELYCGGKGIPQDSDKAMDYLKKSADGGYVIALDKLGEIEINRKNYILAAEYWEKAIQNGSSSLHMYTLASLYIKGNYGIQQNMQRGVELMHKAAELGYPDAQNELGVLYYQGEGVSQNYTEAFKWVQMSANAGSALAQRNLGMFYKQGIGCIANTAMAASWYEKASNQGDFDATVCYAYMLYRGDGVAKQPERTKKLFHKILDTKGLLKTDSELYNNVLYSLASLYTEDLNDPFSAFPLWKEAADLGNPAAQYNLGLCYLKGSGAEKNAEKAKAQFTKALNNGVEEARKGLELIKQ